MNQPIKKGLGMLQKETSICMRSVSVARQNSTRETWKSLSRVQFKRHLNCQLDSKPWVQLISLDSTSSALAYACMLFSRRIEMAASDKNDMWEVASKSTGSRLSGQLWTEPNQATSHRIEQDSALSGHLRAFSRSVPHCHSQANSRKKRLQHKTSSFLVKRCSPMQAVARLCLPALHLFNPFILQLSSITKCHEVIAWE